MIPFQRTSALVAIDARKGLLHGRHILVADDSPAIRFVAATALSGQGAIVQEVSDGGAALAATLAGSSFELILMDVQMPGMNGLEATTKLRQAGLSKLPILALTASNSDVLEACIAVGMNDVLQKPFTQAMLISKAMSLLGCATAEIVATQYHPRPESTESKLFSTESLTVLCSGDSSFVQRLLGIAVQELPFIAQQMREAYSDGCFDQIGKLTHRVRPCVEGLGIAGLPHKLLRIETLIAEESNSTQLGYLVLAVADEMERVARQIITAG